MKSTKKFKNRKGVVGMFIVFVLFAILLLFLFGLAIPFLIQLNSGLYEGGKLALEQVNKSQLPEDISNSLQDAEDSIPSQINILSFFLQYSWFIILIVLMLIIYLRSRTMVETEYK